LIQKRTLVGLCLAPAAAALALTVGVSFALAAPVDPASYSNTLTSGSSVVITKTVHTPAIPPKIDIVFLSDTTGSMGSTISNVQTNATSIMNQVRLGQPDSWFSAANYKDFGCALDPFPFKVDQAITNSIANVQTGINSWFTVPGSGCDTPEAQLNALWEIGNNAVGFRAGSTRVVVWFGDASGHDPSGGHSLADAEASLVGAHVEVIAIPVTTASGDGLNSTGQATAITAATGGVVLPAATPDQVSAAILTGLANLPVTVMPVPTCDSGLTATYDAPSKTVVSGTDVSFSETLSVASNAPDGGTLHCTVDFLLNGQHQDGFQQQVSIDVPLRPADLAIVKTALPIHLTEGNNVTYTLSVTNNGTDPDPGVVASDTLQAGETFVSGDAGCSEAAGVVTCDFGTVAAGATVSKSFVANVPLGAPSSITNTATVTGVRPDPNLANNTSSATITVNHNPVCTALTAGPSLWPPNHKLVTVTVSGATDPDGDVLTTTVTGVTQDEALNGLGDGDTSPDAALVAGHSNQVRLRAERSGLGDGRVYRIATSVSDGDGGSCTGTVIVGVPHDQGAGSTPIDSGLIVDSFGP
jgi:uncharacterized repeat protein (TIGR01451 family)